MLFRQEREFYTEIRSIFSKSPDQCTTVVTHAGDYSKYNRRFRHYDFPLYTGNTIDDHHEDISKIKHDNRVYENNHSHHARPRTNN